MSETVVSIAPADPVLPVGRNIMRNLTPAENSIDHAIAGSSTLLAAVAAGRVASGIALDAGSLAMRRIYTGIGALMEARDEIGAGHRYLAELRDALGFSAEDFGCSATKGSPQAQLIGDG